MDSYELLPLESIPDCCGSCKHLRLIPPRGIVRTDLPPWCKHDYSQICIFAICKNFQRKNSLK